MSRCRRTGSIVGDRIFHVESGIITTWVKNVGQEHLTEAFPFRPEFVGQTGPEIVLGKGSGLDSVHIWLERLGLPGASEDEAMAILQEVKAESLAKKGLLSRGRVPRDRRNGAVEKGEADRRGREVPVTS